MPKAKTIAVDLYAPWARWRADLLRIDARCFNGRGATEEEFEEAVKEQALFLAVIREGDEGIGYCLVVRRWPRTAYIEYVAIDPDHQHKGHLATLVNAVEDELRKCGYEYFEIDCRAENGYADATERHYGDRALVKFDHESALGDMRFFRIRL